MFYNLKNGEFVAEKLVNIDCCEYFQGLIPNCVTYDADSSKRQFLESQNNVHENSIKIPLNPNMPAKKYNGKLPIFSAIYQLLATSGLC